MTIDDKIRHEKLQYDIKRQAAKISALQSVKTDKYEYLTGEGTLPSDQSKFLEQAKFTCSPLGKAFEKQIKRLKSKEKNKWMLLKIKTKDYQLHKDDHKDNHKYIYKETFYEIINEKLDEIKELIDEISLSDLTYYFKCNTARKTFNDLNNSRELFKKIKSGEIKLEEGKQLENVFQSNLN